ncbi:unnamed protein product [Somion occarium]|uniref:NAD(P)-binding protein n=1 Tax=Somion occarium TaxID=3059160 RepID=A0ABP1CSP1_9APHY
MSESYTWLITGASRGLGLEMVRQLLQSSSNTIIAACRTPDNAAVLKSLHTDAKGTLHVIQIDTADEASIRASSTIVKTILGERGLDYLISNAAIGGNDVTAFSFSVPSFRRTLETNVIGPAIVADTFLPLLEKGNRKVLVNISSGLASIGLDFGDIAAVYSISKTALNMLTYKQAKAKPEFIVFCVDPGWVKTDMGGEKAPLEPHESVSKVLKIVADATSQSSGKFFRYDGEVLAW